jgi:hypothetical protein
MQREPTTKKDGPKESAASELRSILPWFLIPVAIILVLVGFVLFLPRDEAEAHAWLPHYSVVPAQPGST